MKIIILKFNLKHEGKLYPAGSIVELPETVAKALVEASPKEFAFIDVPEAAVEDKELDDSAEEGKDLEKMTVEELKLFAANNGINIGKATRKFDIISAIVNACGEGEGLPEVDVADVVK